MRKNLGKQTLIYPMPVLIIATYDENGNPNAMNAAWGGIKDTNQIYICLSANHKTASNLLKTQSCTVSIADEKNVVPADYVGIVSGNTQPSKFEKTGWTTKKSSFVNAPLINELPFTLECQLVSYDSLTGMLIADIINLSVDESILTEKNKIDMSKFSPIIFDSDNLNYMKLGSVIGKAFRDGIKLKE